MAWSPQKERRNYYTLRVVLTYIIFHLFSCTCQFCFSCCQVWDIGISVPVRYTDPFKHHHRHWTPEQGSSAGEVSCSSSSCWRIRFLAVNFALLAHCSFFPFSLHSEFLCFLLRCRDTWCCVCPSSNVSCSSSPCRSISAIFSFFRWNHLLLYSTLLARCSGVSFLLILLTDKWICSHLFCRCSSVIFLLRSRSLWRFSSSLWRLEW